MTEAIRPVRREADVKNEITEIERVCDGRSGKRIVLRFHDDDTVGVAPDVELHFAADHAVGLDPCDLPRRDLHAVWHDRADRGERHMVASGEVGCPARNLKRLTITGSTLRAQSFEQKAVMTREILETLYPHLESGAVRPVIDSVFSLEEVEQAHARMQSGEHMGKIVLEVADTTPQGETNA